MINLGFPVNKLNVWQQLMISQQTMIHPLQLLGNLYSIQWRKIHDMGNFSIQHYKFPQIIINVANYKAVAAKKRWKYSFLDPRFLFITRKKFEGMSKFQRFFRRRRNVEKRWKIDVEILTVPAWKVSFIAH